MCRAFRPSAMLPRRRLRFIQKCTLFYSELRAGSPSRKPTPLCCTRFRAPMSQRYVPQIKATDLTAREIISFVRAFGSIQFLTEAPHILAALPIWPK